MEAIAYHGWGFSGSCWKPWEALLARRGVTLKVFDRGYYGDPAVPSFSPDTARRIVIVHSFGLHLCSRDLRQAADLLIVLSGFNPFHPLDGPAKRRSRRLYDAMCAQFPHEPLTVLDTFFERCDCPELAQPERNKHMNVELLQKDLHDLGEAFIDLRKSSSICRTLVLHGTKDRIVPVDKGRELALQLGHSASFLEIKDAGHALPFTHADECGKLVEHVMEGCLNR